MLGVGRRLGWWRTEGQAEGLSSIEQIGASPASGIEVIFRGWTLQGGEFGGGSGGIWTNLVRGMKVYGGFLEHKGSSGCRAGLRPDCTGCEAGWVSLCQ